MVNGNSTKFLHHSLEKEESCQQMGGSNWISTGDRMKSDHLSPLCKEK